MTVAPGVKSVMVNASMSIADGQSGIGAVEEHRPLTGRAVVGEDVLVVVGDTTDRVPLVVRLT